MEEKHQDCYNVAYIHTVLYHPYNKYIGGLFTVCRFLSVKAVVSAIGAIPCWTQWILHMKSHSFSSWVVQLALWQAGHPHGLRERERGGELEGHREVETEEDRKLTERMQEKERDLSWRVNEVQQSFRADSSSRNELAPSPLATPPPPPPLSCWLSVPQITTDSRQSLPPQVPILSSNSTRIRKV